VHVQQPAAITDPNQPTQLSAIPITNQPTQGFSVTPITNQPTQSVLSVTSANSVTNQQPGTAPTGIQSQIVTGAPTSTQTRTAAPLSVTGGEQIGIIQPRQAITGIDGKQISITTPSDAIMGKPFYGWSTPASPFKSVSVTNPYAGSAADGGIGNTQDPMNNKTYIPNINQQEFHVDPSAAINNGQPILDANGRWTGRWTGGGNPGENTTPVYLRQP
jgi:hypothetical protein